MIKKTIVFMVLWISTLSIFAQDRIVQLSKDTIHCYIREIGDEEVKYTKEGHRADLLFGIDKNKISEILFADGKTMKFKDSMQDPSYYENQRKSALKISFLTPMFNSTNLSYEKSLGVAKSIEGTLGIIGIGYNGYGIIDPKGIYLKLGYKFIKSPDFYLKGMRYAHILKGSYFKPELAFTSYSYSDSFYGTNLGNANFTHKETLVAFLLNVGKQWVLDDRFLVDCFVGIGYAFGQGNSSESIHFAFTGATSDSPFAITSGLKIGILLK